MPYGEESAPGPRPSSDVVEEVARLTAHQRRLFDLLAARPAGLTVSELAVLLGSHENTVRGHLETLEARHLVRSTTRLPKGRGRPSRVYQARAATPHLPGEFLAGLIRTLMSTLAPERDDGVARTLGRVWALDLMAEGRFDAHTVDPLRELETLFAQMGCAPQACSGGVLELRHCPFMEPGTPLPSSVCSLHRGAIETLVDRVARNRPCLGITGAELTPRTGQGCLIRVHTDHETNAATG